MSFVSLDAENVHRNSIKRTTTTSKASSDLASRRNSKTTQKSKRRESDQSSISSICEATAVVTIAGKPRYSDMAKEHGWVDQELIEAIERDIVDHGEKIMFDDIAGLEHTKQLLQETVMLPQIAPHLFEVLLVSGLAYARDMY